MLRAKEAIDTNPHGYRKMKSSRYCAPCYEDAVRANLRRGNRSYSGESTKKSADTDYHGEQNDF